MTASRSLCYPAHAGNFELTDLNYKGIMTENNSPLDIYII